MTPRELYESSLPLIEEVIEWICRRHFMAEADADDFAQSVHLKLMADDYRVFRSYRGQSSLKTYLISVIQRHLLDWRNHRWGKYRPTAEALRLGKVAVKLEELMRRDELSLSEACEVLLKNFRVEVSRAELERMASLFPQQTPREQVSDAVLDDVPAKVERPEEGILEDELEPTRQLLLAALESALAELSAEDRLVIEMCILGGRRIAEAARFLGLPQKPLYRRKGQILAGLRQALEREGFSWDQVAELLGLKEIRWD